MLHPDLWLGLAQLTGRRDFRALRSTPEDVPDGEALRRVGIPAPPSGCGSVAPDIAMISIRDPRYPEPLASQPFAPPVLFARGNLALLSQVAVAIVGARRCSDLGRRFAMQLARRVVASGCVVVSGNAFGIDRAAQEAAHGAAIAVLGRGLEVADTPSAKRGESSLLDQGGLVLSELPPTMPAAPWTFPLRNRIIAWLSRAVIVAEAGARSGALGTARAAVDAGREVFAVPMHPLVPGGHGCLSLLAQGAGVVVDGSEVLACLGLDGGADSAPDAHPWDRQLRGAGTTIEALAVQLDLPLASVAAQLSTMELAGRVTRLRGDRYVLKVPP